MASAPYTRSYLRASPDPPYYPLELELELPVVDHLQTVYLHMRARLPNTGGDLWDSRLLAHNDRPSLPVVILLDQAASFKSEFEFCWIVLHP